MLILKQELKALQKPNKNLKGEKQSVYEEKVIFTHVTTFDVFSFVSCL